MQASLPSKLPLQTSDTMRYKSLAAIHRLVTTHANPLAPRFHAAWHQRRTMIHSDLELQRGKCEPGIFPMLQIDQMDPESQLPHDQILGMPMYFISCYFHLEPRCPSELLTPQIERYEYLWLIALFFQELCNT